jgi:hypothetical protein
MSCLRLGNCNIITLRDNSWLYGSVITDFLQIISKSVGNDRPTGIPCRVLNYGFAKILTQSLPLTERGRTASRMRAIPYEKTKPYLNGGDLVFIINHGETHWGFCIISFPMSEDKESRGSIRIQDPYNNSTRIYDETIGHLKIWIEYEFSTYKKQRVQWDCWDFFDPCERTIAAQTDGSSCGVFTALGLYYYITKKRLPTKNEFCQTFNQEGRMFILKTLFDKRKEAIVAV